MQTNLLILLVCVHHVYAQENIPDSKLNFTGLAVKYRQKVEDFDIITEDGYFLKLFHIKGDRRRPVLLVHGIMDSSDGFIIRGNLSLAVNLARHGYDVWAINHRGNRYSRRHLTLDPDKDPIFWNFHAHEYGSKDLPAAIDFIIEKTGSKVNIIGYSEGTTNTLILGATRPEYNEKVNVFIALAPVCFLHHTEQPMTTVLNIAPDINRSLRKSGNEEVIGFYSPIKSLMKAFCSTKGAGYMLCLRGVTFQLTGVDPDQFEPDFLPTWLEHFPAGSSRKNFNHFVQIGTRKRFAYYDYGPKRNLQKYGTKVPPQYDLEKVTMKVALLVAKNDRVSTIKDVELLRKRLPNVVEYRVMQYDMFNHLDFVWGKTTFTIVLPHVLEILEKYG